jgi:preprotein translocase subunit YajC
MPEQKDRRGLSTIWVIVLVVLALVLFYLLAILPVQRRVTAIHTYLGNYHPSEEPRQWKGLTGAIADDNRFLQEKLKQLGCEIKALRHEESDECAPSGPPSTKPSGPPPYP